MATQADLYTSQTEISQHGQDAAAVDVGVKELVRKYPNLMAGGSAAEPQPWGRNNDDYWCRQYYENQNLAYFSKDIGSPEALELRDAYKTHYFGFQQEHVITREQLEDEYELGYDRLITCGKLGAGNAGFVLKVRDKTGQDPNRACKFIKSIGSEKDISIEISAVNFTQRPEFSFPAFHVLPIHGHFYLADWYCVVMPLAEANLWDILKDFQKFILPSAFRIPYWRDTFFTWISCLSHTLLAVHERGIGHGDIKLTNILVSGRSVFLGDFGLTQAQKKIAQEDIFSLGGVIWEILRTLSKPFLHNELPAVDPQDYTSSLPSINKLDWVIERVSLLENPEQFKSLIRRLIGIVLCAMVIQPTKRKELSEVCDEIDIAMAQLEFQRSCQCHRTSDAKARESSAKFKQSIKDAIDPKFKEWQARNQPAREQLAKERLARKPLIKERLAKRYLEAAERVRQLPPEPWWDDIGTEDL